MRKTVAMKDELLLERIFAVIPGNFELAGEVSSSVKKVLRKMGIDAELIRRICVACYEAEMNMVIHSVGGNLTLQVTPDRITVIAEDRGPGIPDIDLAMQEGYSTAPEMARELGFGAGMGLPNIKRCADILNVHSKMGEGTLLEAHFDIKAR